MHSCKIYRIYKNMHIQILDLISWRRETNLFRTLLYLTIIQKSMQMLEVHKPSYVAIPFSVFERYADTDETRWDLRPRSVG
jgi:hypothetical protein